MRPDTPMEPDPSAPPQITDADYNAAMNDTEPRDFNERPLSQQSLRPEAKFDYSRTAEVDDTIEMLRKKKMRVLIHCMEGRNRSQGGICPGRGMVGRYQQTLPSFLPVSKAIFASEYSLE